MGNVGIAQIYATKMLPKLRTVGAEASASNFLYGRWNLWANGIKEGKGTGHVFVHGAMTGDDNSSIKLAHCPGKSRGAQQLFSNESDGCQISEVPVITLGGLLE